MVMRARYLKGQFKRLLGAPEDVPADERAGKFQERFVNVGSTFKPDAKTMETMEPRVSPFNDPAKFSEAAAVFGAALRDRRFDATFAQSLTVPVGIVATIGIGDLRLLKRPTAHATNRRIASTSGSSWVTSFRFAPVRIALTGTPLASTRIWCLEQGRPRSVGFGPVLRSPQRLVPTTNRQQRVRSRFDRPRATCRAAVRAAGPIIPAFCRSRSRRQQVAPEPKPNRVGRWFLAALFSTRIGCH